MKTFNTTFKEESLILKELGEDTLFGYKIFLENLTDGKATAALKAGKWRDKAFDVKKRSEDLYSEIEAIKVKLVVDAGGYELDENGRAPRNFDWNKYPYQLRSGGMHRGQHCLNF